MSVTKHPLVQFKYCPKCGSEHFNENNFKSKKCSNCGFVYYFNPSASTVGLIYNSNGELLVATRAKEPSKGTYDLPGGFVDMFETGEDAIRREVKEETNLDVVDLKYLFSVPNTYIYSGFEVHTLDMVFKCYIEDFSHIKADDDVNKLSFISREKLDLNTFGLLSIKGIIKKIKEKEL